MILRVTEIVPQTVAPLSELEGEIRETLAEKKAADVIFDTHDKIEDERAAGDPLAEAANEGWADCHYHRTGRCAGQRPLGQAG